MILIIIMTITKYTIKIILALNGTKINKAVLKHILLQ